MNGSLIHTFVLARGVVLAKCENATRGNTPIRNADRAHPAGDICENSDIVEFSENNPTEATDNRRAQQANDLRRR